MARTATPHSCWPLLAGATAITIFAASIVAQSNINTIAGLSGKIVGAARACGIDGNRLATTTERVFRVINQRARSKSEAGDATLLFAKMINVGVDEIASRRTSCEQARKAFADIEQQFRNY